MGALATDALATVSVTYDYSDLGGTVPTLALNRQPNAIPEPGTGALLGLSLALFAAARLLRLRTGGSQL